MRLILAWAIVQWRLSASANAREPSTPATELGSNLPAQLAGPNDLIGLSVYEAPD